MSEPKYIVAGDTQNWRTSYSDYPASEGWALAYRIYNADNNYDADAATDGDEFVIEIAATETDTWLPGEYKWAALVSKDDQRFTAAQGVLTIRPNPVSDSGVDGRTHPEKVLDAINKVIEGKASRDQQSFKIGDRELVRIPMAELLTLKARYERYVEQERKAQGLQVGNQDKTTYVRFGR